MILNEIKSIYRGLKFYELCLAFILLSMGIFFLALTYTVLVNGGLEYTVKIGK